MAVRIVTDSTSDLPPGLAEEMGITVIPALIHFGEETFKDGVDLTVEEFFGRLVEADELPTTSQAPVNEFAHVYQSLISDGHSAVSIHISGKVSGTVNSATQGMQVVGTDQIEVVDSGFWSGALGLIVLEAAEAARSGKGFEEVVSVAQGARARAGLVAMADTLEYAAKGGRIEKIQYLLGSLLHLENQRWGIAPRGKA
jgi:DegV family protein with EDD domain